MTPQKKLAFKNKLKQLCHSIIEQRITTTKTAIEEAQQTANLEGKSSAGDKYETSRAMGHLEKDMQSRQLAAHLKEMASLHSVNIEPIYETPSTGAFIQCTHISFFIACGLGKQMLEGNPVIFLSPYAPLAKSLSLKKKGDSIDFSGIQNIIIDVF
ncbi:MAG: hypothetical protein ABIN89_28670 [Chitinophagaceae bacterium]